MTKLSIILSTALFLTINCFAISSPVHPLVLLVECNDLENTLEGINDQIDGLEEDGVSNEIKKELKL